ncbi:MAG TPA: alpha/beta hydrolase [Pyrinomonadaceae bacterium]|jgi:pimeloyl-ACP methyl ester carboxylesterase
MNKKNLALGVGGALGAVVAWKFLTRAGSVDWSDFAEKVHHAENSNFVEVDGATVHFQEFGDSVNPTLLLIHGYTASTYVWKTVAPVLAGEGFHVVALDLLGFGYSDKPASFDYSIASQARVVERFMNRLGIGRASVVGSSYGGAVASVLALDYPERVEKLILADAVCNDDALAHPALRIAAVPGVGELLAPFLIDSKRFLRRRMMGTLAPENHHLITDDRIESILRPVAAADAHHSFLATARAWDACRIQEDAQYIKQPTLIIWGEKDTVIPKINGERLFDSILNSRLVVFKNCGHMPQEEKPELFTRVVSDFCRDSRKQIEANEEMLTGEAA